MIDLDTYRTQRQLGKLGDRLREDVDLLCTAMDRGELKDSDISLLKFAIYCIRADRALIGDFATGIAIVFMLADGVR
jgi:hypothetical protein